MAVKKLQRPTRAREVLERVGVYPARAKVMRPGAGEVLERVGDKPVRAKVMRPGTRELLSRDLSKDSEQHFQEFVNAATPRR